MVGRCACLTSGGNCCHSGPRPTDPGRERMIAQVGDGRVAVGYDDIGKGPPVVFLHAFPLNRTMWAPQPTPLPAEWRCLPVAIRGSGESTAPGPFTTDGYAAAVAAVLVAPAVSRATVF